MLSQSKEVINILNYDDLDEEQRERIFNSKMVQKYLAYKSLVDGIQALKEDDVLYKQLIDGIKQRIGGKLTKRSIRSVINKLVEEVNAHTNYVDEEGK